ncbi:MAG: helix-turn-helix domain-containing protein [Candidatus Micrarchaeota archaeon]
MEIERALEGLGLTKNETKTYLALLSTGPTTSGAIISTSGLYRPAVYEALDRLIAKGLVSFVMKNNRKHFEAAEPERLVDLVEEMKRKVRDAVPELKKLSSFDRKGEATTLFLGVRGIRGVLDSLLEELKEGGEYVDFGVSGRFRDVMGPYWDAWQKSKQEMRVVSRCIFDESLRESRLIEDYYGKARFVPRRFHCPSDTMVYGEKVVIFIWNAKPPTAIVIRDAETSKGYLNLFNWMWKNAAR